MLLLCVALLLAAASAEECRQRPCFRKCCPMGEFVVNKTCVPQEEPFRPPPSVVRDLGRFHLITGMECPPNRPLRLLVNPSDKSRQDDFEVRDDGTLYLPSGPSSYQPLEYCVDVIQLDGFEEDAVRALSCNLEYSEITQKFYCVGMIISMPFLLVTFIVYAVLPDRNLHGKALMCYVISLFGAYVLLVIIQMSPHMLENHICIGIGLSCLFCFMASFFWMNVMSIDIWWAFRGMRGFSGSKKEAEQKRFLLYCLYAWGMPVVHVLLVLYLALGANLLPYAWYNPQFGNGKCWFKEGIPTLLYFYGPMSALIVMNIVLFVVTACRINRVQRDTAVLRKEENKRHSYENDKQRFNLYVKLMLAMGVNWSMEIISWAVIYWQVGNLPNYIWYLTDACNALYGVFIFFIFVFKRNIWKLLKRRYYLLMGKPHLARSMTQNAYSPRTTTSTVSQTADSKSGNYTTESSVYTSEVA